MNKGNHAYQSHRDLQRPAQGSAASPTKFATGETDAQLPVQLIKHDDFVALKTELMRKGT